MIEKCIVRGGYQWALNINVGVARNCLVIRQGAYPNSGLSVQGNANCYGVTVINFGSSTTGIGLNYSGGSTLKNCAAFGFATAVAYANSSGATFTTCATDQASPPTGWTGSVAFSTATFLNVTSGSEDLRLASGSALIDAGTTDATNMPLDIFGTSRPTGSAYDIGPHEYVSPPVQNPLFVLRPSFFPFLSM